MSKSATQRPLSTRIKRALKKPGVRFGRALERWVANQSPMGDTSVIDGSHFDWVASLEENSHLIRRELDEVMACGKRLPNIQDQSPTQRSLTLDDGWKTYFFYVFGRRIDESCVRCPETSRVLNAIPGLSLACFSVLAPGKHIPRHRGAYKGVVRAHLGLIVPEPRMDVRMRVGKEMIYWEEGKCVVFDDTYKHEVWNDTDSVRVVLLIDVRRPLPGWLARVNRTLIQLAGMSPEVRRIVRTQRKWEASH